ncbi:T9SS type A sorting domain-containing protein [candidate division KSB1 bacterium]|nr:T9SS type A sorting domain-containing protein [candidate division KSB1 bacterium]
MRRTQMAFLFLLLSVCTLFSATRQERLLKLDAMESRYDELVKNSADPQQRMELKKSIFEQRRELLNIQSDPLYDMHDVMLDEHVRLNDLYVYPASDTYVQLYARLQNTSAENLNFVQLEFIFYKNNAVVATDFSFIDFETYGTSGILPFEETFVEALTEKSDFDSMSVLIQYQIDKYRDTDILWDSVLDLQETEERRSGSNLVWQGLVHNQSEFSVDFGIVFASFYRDGKMIGFDKTFVDENDQEPRTIRIVSVIDLPDSYNEINLQNYADESLSLDGWHLSPQDSELAHALSGTLNPGAFLTLDASELPFPVDRQQTYVLTNDQGAEIDVWSRSSENRIPPGMRAHFDEITPFEATYDEVRYRVQYGLYSLQGDGNLPPNAPLFSQASLQTTVGEPTPVTVFLLDREWDDMTLTFEHNGTALGPFANGAVTTELIFDDPDLTSTRGRAMDTAGNPSRWSSLIDLDLSQELTLLREPLSLATYGQPFRDTLNVLYESTSLQWQIADGQLTPGLALDPATGVISGSPDSSGQFDFLVQVQAGADPAESDSAWFSLTVLNSAPVIDMADTLVLYSDSLFVFQIQTSDAEDNPVTIEVQSKPPWLEWDGVQATGRAPAEPQIYFFTFRASDGDLFSSHTLVLDVVTLNHPPVLVSSQSVEAWEDSLFVYHARAKDADGQELFFSFDDLPSWCAVIDDSTISGTPVEGTTDTSFVLLVTDGKATDSTRVQVTVHPVNDPPRFTSPDSVVAMVDSIFIYRATVYDPDSEPDIQFVTIPPWCRYDQNVLTGIPPSADAMNWFIVAALDQDYQTDTLWVTIDIRTDNVAPEIVNLKPLALVVDEPVHIDLDTCVTDINDAVEALSWHIESENDLITAELQGHVLTLTAISAGKGTDWLVFRVSDQEGASDSLRLQVSLSLPSAVEHESVLPDELTLHRAYPNPFNPGTTLAFDLPANAHVRLTIYDRLGRIVRVLANRRYSPGAHQIYWNGRDDHGAKVGSGLYFYRLETPNHVLTGKMSLVK